MTLLLRLSNLLLELGTFLGHDDRSRMHIRNATYFQMRPHLISFSSGRRRPYLVQLGNCWGIERAKCLSHPEAAHVVSKWWKKCCSPRVSASVGRNLANSLYIRERERPRSFKKKTCEACLFLLIWICEWSSWFCTRMQVRDYPERDVGLSTSLVLKSGSWRFRSESYHLHSHHTADAGWPRRTTGRCRGHWGPFP